MTVVPDELTDEQAVETFREVFHNGPIARWFGDHDINMGFGGGILFHEDGTGVDFAWDDEGEYEDAFLWTIVAPQTIAFRPHPKSSAQECDELWRDVRYDFEVRRSPYGNRRILLVEVDGEPNSHGERCFRGPTPVVLDEDDRKRLKVWERDERNQQ